MSLPEPKKTHCITAALPYANGALHLGHLAGAYLPADVYARTLRLLDKDVVFVCGSDEHGAAITLRAKKEGRSPREIIDHYHELNRASFEQLGISFDVYHRTSDPLHHQTAQAFFEHLAQMPEQLSEAVSEQYYDETYKQFLADRYIVGTCPKCGHEEAYGDQCEQCGASLSPADLIQPRSVLSGERPVLKQTKHWYFHLEKHNEWLKTWLETGQVEGQQTHDPKTWRKHVLGQCLSWLDAGLQPRAITRDLDWGVALPLPDAQGKVLYVWFDAPIGYISATKAWAEAKGKDWRDYWQNPEASLTHFIGKDNIVFHCIIFPAMLKAHGSYVLPKQVPANQFLNLEGKKFSKSRGWVIEQHQYLADFKDFPNKEDALRYALLRTLPENKDGDFKWEEFVDLHDGELADILGNFVHRVLSFSEKYFASSVPAFALDTQLRYDDNKANTRSCGAFLLELGKQLDLILAQVEGHQYREGIQSVMDLARMGNAWLQHNEPWKVYKQNPQDPMIAAVVGLGLEVAAVLSVALGPFLPQTSDKLRHLLQLPSLERGEFVQVLQRLKRGQALLRSEHKLAEKQLLFVKIRDPKNPQYLALIEAQKEKLKTLVAAAPCVESVLPAILPEIAFEDFAKLDLRIGKVLQANKVPKTDKLLQLQIDLGEAQPRTIVSGIAEHYQPEDLLNKQVLVLANLAPRKMRGIESQGMILMAQDQAGKLILLSPQSLAQIGSQVR